MRHQTIVRRKACTLSGPVHSSCVEAYPIREIGVENVVVQPLDGSAAHQITNFQSEEIWSFSWSPDGNNLGILRFAFSISRLLTRATARRWEWCGIPGCGCSKDRFRSTHVWSL